MCNRAHRGMKMGWGWLVLARQGLGALVLFSLGCGTASSLHKDGAASSKQTPALVRIPFSLEGLTISVGETCAQGTRLVTEDEFKLHRAQVCRRLGQWDIVRLAQKGSADGPGYECQSRSKDNRSLGGALCVGTEAVEFTCYWMENYSGKYAWVTPPRGFYDGQGKARCQALDSCDGGGRTSGGGCYKWSAGPKAPR